MLLYSPLVLGFCCLRFCVPAPAPEQPAAFLTVPARPAAVKFLPACRTVSVAMLVWILPATCSAILLPACHHLPYLRRSAEHAYYCRHRNSATRFPAVLGLPFYRSRVRFTAPAPDACHTVAVCSCCTTCPAACCRFAAIDSASLLRFTPPAVLLVLRVTCTCLLPAVQFIPFYWELYRWIYQYLRSTVRRRWFCLPTCTWILRIMGFLRPQFFLPIYLLVSPLWVRSSRSAA